MRTAAAASPIAAGAQQPSVRPVRVGILTPGGHLRTPLFAALRQEMGRLGFLSAGEDADRLPELAINPTSSSLAAHWGIAYNYCEQYERLRAQRLVRPAVSG